ncbi:MAG: TonB-dependent receptor [Candidatus Solibacter sp.]
MKFDRRRMLEAYLPLLLLLCLPALSLAQTSTVLSGTVTDPSDAAVPGAVVTLTNKTTGVLRTDKSDDTGAFIFPQLQPGLYDLKAEKQGFKAIVSQSIDVLVNTSSNIALRFKEVGAVTETVQVSAEATAVNTVDATIGIAFNATQVRDLPLNARNVVGLLSLQPGVTAGGSVNGGRFDQANVTLDGVDVNDQDQYGGDSRSGNAFFSVLRVTPDSLQEFRVTTTNANADQGRSSGAQIALVTKSGGNQFHGSLYEYHRNTLTSANDWFSNKAGVQRPQLIRNNFGGSVGGPIKKDKLFFFFNYEGFREAKGSVVVNQIPLATLGQGTVRYFSANGASDPTCPAGTPSGVTCLTRQQISQSYATANRVDPGTNSTGLAILAAAAAKYTPNDTTVGDGLNTSGIRFNSSAPVKQSTAAAKIDYLLNSKHSLYVRFNYQNDISLGTSRFPDTPQVTTWAHPRGLSAGDTWTVTPNIVNSFRYGITRDAITTGGDSDQNSVNFRFIFQPLNYSRGRIRTTPVHNFVDDISINKGRHTLQAGINFRLITNSRNAFTSSYDSLVTNPSFYEGSGDSVTLDAAGNNIFPNLASRSATNARDAITAIVGRLSQYGASLVYDRAGKVQANGTGVARKFKTNEYEGYFQDSWRVTTKLTLTGGLRWSTGTPVYEADGYQVSPTQGLGDYFDKRVAGSAAGTPYNNLITLDYSGKANNKPGFYSQDWNNFAPSGSVAWQFAKKMVLRGGYRLTYDRIGSALAVNFDALNSIGFTSAASISANTFNLTTNLAPLLTGLSQDVRGLPKLIIPPSLAFPAGQPADSSRRIERSLDDRLTTPYNHSFNLSLGRDLGRGFSIEASYVGRIARNLLIARDVMTPNNITDPKSGVNWYTAIRQLIDLRDKVTPVTSVAAMPFFENLLPKLAGSATFLGQTVNLTATQAAYRRIARTVVGGQNTTDYTTVQDLWDFRGAGTAPVFYQPQYGALSVFSTLGTSDYNSAQFTVRKRLEKGFSFDFNYTAGHSLDTASGAQNGTNFGGPFVENPFNLNENRGNSNFDIRHVVNMNYLYELPFGKGKMLLPDMHGVGQAILGGWSTTGIFRWASGLPAGQPFDSSQWATNFNVQSNAVAIRELVATPTRTGDPNLFSDPTYAYNSYRNAYPGEFGNRNVLRYPSSISLDMGLYKTFSIVERLRATLRAEAFNVSNTQRFSGISSFGLVRDPFTSQTPGGTPPAPPSTFGKFTGIQGTPRVFQFALRLDF